MNRRPTAIALAFLAVVACKPRADASSLDASPSSPPAPVASAAKPPPVPPEPALPLAAKAGEVPGLEAKLAADKAYQALWAADHAADRAVFLTALSDIVAYGTMHSDVEAAVKKAKLAEVVTTVQKVLWRVGKLPAALTTKIEEQLAANKTSPRLGLWNPEEKGKPLVDATALAMWLHPNEPAYVRERMLALVKGPFPANKDVPVARAWLANLGDVMTRLGALGGFAREDCLAIGAQWTEKPLGDGRTQNVCEPPDERAKAAMAATAKKEAEEWKPLQSAWDGEVLAVKNYLSETLNDPDSYQHDKCSTPKKDGSLWVVECSYRAKNAFGGVVRAAQRFYIDKGGFAGEGHVVRAEPLR